MTKKIIASQTIAVGSGKGGVGKSTVSVNLAISLARLGFKVGLLDADLYGPSIPIMLGLRRLPASTDNNEIHPFSKFGIKVISLGFFIDEAMSVLRRGPMLHSMLETMINNVSWGPLDFLVIDLPPGTGDIPISLSTLMEIQGSLVVTTPQEVALLDALKAINAFYELKIPLLGIVENMAGFTPPGSDITYPIFGQGKGQELADKFSVPLLASIPLNQRIREGGDEGLPSACLKTEKLSSASFHTLAENLLQLFNMAVQS